MDNPVRTKDSSPPSSKQSFPVSITAALSTINVVLLLSHCIQVNLHQCKRLVDFYRRAQPYFDELKRSGVFVQEHLCNDALNALNEGSYLLHDYLEENWRTSMQSAGVNQDAFARIYVKLENSFRAICENIEAGVLENRYTYHKELYLLLEFDTLAPLYFLNEDCRATLFKRDAQMDKEHMLEIITGSSQNKYTIERIESTTITTNGLRASLNREQGPLAEALLKNKEAKLVLSKKLVDKQLEEAGERLNEKEMLFAVEMLRREEGETLLKKQAEQLLKQAVEEEAERKKQAEELLRKELQEEKLFRERLEEELVETVELLEKKEALDFVREKVALAIKENLGERGGLGYTRTDLLPDFKIQSSEIQIGEEIGSGGFATIHKCQWQNHDYAVKIFKATEMEELRTEVQNLVLLPRHPNIVLLVGFSIRETHGNPMLLMELLDGDLHTLVYKGESAVETKKKHKLRSTMSRLFGRDAGPSTSINGRDAGPSTAIKIDFIYQIAKGMLFLHKRKVFHGDLKAKNVLVKQRPGDSIQLKIADFGVSEKLSLERTYRYRNRRDSDADFDCTAYSNHSSLGIRHISQEGNVQQVVLGNVGTVRWMAPEVYGIPGTTDMKPYSMKADVYSFAMTCVEILTGQHPFPNKGSLKDVKLHVKSGGRPDLSTLKNTFPKTLLHLVQRCWDPNPSSRPDFSEIYSGMEKLKKAFPIN